MDNWEFLEGFSSGYFTLFSPQSGPHTISEQLGTSGWVLVGLWSIRTLPIGRQASFFPFSPKCVTYIQAQSPMSIRFHNHYYFRYHTFNLKVSSMAMEMRPYTSRNG